MPRKPPGLFITGTDTGVGKTCITAMIARDLIKAGRRVGVYKPVASGCRTDEQGRLVSDDALALWEATGRPGTLEQVCPQRFLAPLAPHRAAMQEGREIDVKLLRSGLAYWQAESDIVLVEGVGGLMCPLSNEEYVADLAEEFGYPLIVVARNALGAVSQTLSALIVAATYRDGIDVAGVILNEAQPDPADVSVRTNRTDIAARCVPPVLAEVGWREGSFSEAVDWFELASRSRE
jgi:dethiobiotin synthetase